MQVLLSRSVWRNICLLVCLSAATAIAEVKYRDCSVCNGTGHIQVTVTTYKRAGAFQSYPTTKTEERECPRCHGTGKIDVPQAPPAAPISVPANPSDSTEKAPGPTDAPPTSMGASEDLMLRGLQDRGLPTLMKQYLKQRGTAAPSTPGGTAQNAPSQIVMEADKYNLPAVLAEVNEKIRSIKENANLTSAQREEPIQTAVGAFREFVESRLWIIPCVILDVSSALDPSTLDRMTIKERSDLLERQDSLWNVKLEIPSLGKSVTIRCEMEKSKALAFKKGDNVQIQAKLKVRYNQAGDFGVGLGSNAINLALESASLAPDGLPVEAKEITFLGIKIKKPRSVVYIIDRSGSMTDSIDYVKYELKRSIGELDEECQFHVIFYSSGPPLEMPSKALVKASPDNKQMANNFVDSVKAQGETDPSKALERAFANKPEVIYLLTDGEFDRQIIDIVKRLNTGHKVVVHTIGFLYKTGEEVLTEIAKDNGGTYKFVSEADLATLSQR